MTYEKPSRNDESGKGEDDPDLLEAEAYELLAKAKRIRAEKRTPVADWIPIARAAEIASSTERAIKDAARKGGWLGRGVVRRSDLDRYLSTAPTKTTKADEPVSETTTSSALERAARRWTR